MYISLMILVKLSEKRKLVQICWERAGKETVVEFLWWLGPGLKFPPDTKKRLLWLSYSFSQMSVEEGEGRVELRSPQMPNISAVRLV